MKTFTIPAKIEVITGAVTSAHVEDFQLFAKNTQELHYRHATAIKPVKLDWANLLNVPPGIQAYTAGAGIAFNNSAISLNLPGLNLISGAAVEDSDFMLVYDQSIGSHYRLVMGGLKAYIGAQDYTAGAGIAIAARVIKLDLSTLNYYSNVTTGESVATYSVVEGTRRTQIGQLPFMPKSPSVSNVAELTDYALWYRNGTTNRILMSDLKTLIGGGAGSYTAGEGIDIVGSVISGEDASTTNKGIASFSGTNFSVNSGAVGIKSGGVNAENLNANIISGQSELTIGLASTDELLISDAGVLKRMDVSVLQGYMQNNLNFGSGSLTTRSMVVPSGTVTNIIVASPITIYNPVYLGLILVNISTISTKAFHSSCLTFTRTNYNNGTVSVKSQYINTEINTGIDISITIFNGNMTSIRISNNTGNDVIADAVFNE